MHTNGHHNGHHNGIKSGYRHTNQHHNGHHDGHHDGHHNGHHKKIMPVLPVVLLIMNAILADVKRNNSFPSWCAALNGQN